MKMTGCNCLFRFYSNNRDEIQDYRKYFENNDVKLFFKKMIKMV